MNSVPVSNQNESEKDERDEQETGRFRGINGVVMMVLVRVVGMLRNGHADIVVLLRNRLSRPLPSDAFSWTHRAGNGDPKACLNPGGATLRRRRC